MEMNVMMQVKYLEMGVILSADKSKVGIAKEEQLQCQILVHLLVEMEEDSTLEKIVMMQTTIMMMDVMLIVLSNQGGLVMEDLIF